MSNIQYRIKCQIHDMIPIDCEDNLIIREYQMKDCHLFYQYTSDKELSKYLQCNPTESYECAHVFIKGVQERYVEEKMTRFIIADAITDDLIGALSLYVSESGQTIEFGYWIGKPHWGNRYMHKVLTKTISKLKEIPELKRVQVRVDENNKASIRVAQKLGMRVRNRINQNNGSMQLIMGMNIRG